MLLLQIKFEYGERQINKYMSMPLKKTKHVIVEDETMNKT